MEKLFGYAEEYIEQSDWKTLAALKFCLTSLGVLIGMALPQKCRKCAKIIASVVFAVTYEYLRWIAVPCLCHAAANIVIFIITFFGAFGKLINVGRFAEFLVIAAVSPAVVLRGPEFMRYWKRRQN